MNTWLSNEKKENLSTFYKAFSLVARFVYLIFLSRETRVFAETESENFRILTEYVIW